VVVALLGALAAARLPLSPDELVEILERAGVAIADGRAALEGVIARGWVRRRGALCELRPDGLDAFLAAHAALEEALDITSHSAVREDCPSVPWLTTVRTAWIDGVSLNYAVSPDALARILPPPLEPELHHGSAWVQVLISSLRDLRPQGLGALFGVCFYQASYRAAVRYRSVDGSWRRGGCFVRSDTNHPIMRAVGNRLAEFKFHDFGLADMVMLRDGEHLTIGVDPGPEAPGGRLVARLDTRPRSAPPPRSRWRSLEELHQPLVECYDALGVDREGGWLYVLTIDRDPWNPRFVEPVELYAEYFDTGALGGGAAELDSVLHFRECGYRWRPLRREPLA
jgi:uncharacterized protein YqjF (DUF2071 family)